MTTAPRSGASWERDRLQLIPGEISVPIAGCGSSPTWRFCARRSPPSATSPSGNGTSMIVVGDPSIRVSSSIARQSMTAAMSGPQPNGQDRWSGTPRARPAYRERRTRKAPRCCIYLTDCNITRRLAPTCQRRMLSFVSILETSHKTATSDRKGDRRWTPGNQVISEEFPGSVIL